MTQFKVGDRVRCTFDGDEGPVTGITGALVYVDWDKDGELGMDPEELELVEEQSNRTYYEPTEIGQTSREKDPGNTVFEDNVHRILNGVAETIVQKNASYGDSALNPIRVFSKSGRMEQLFVRLDDKLSRVQRGSEYPGDDTLRDIIGYCTLVLIARESE